MDERQFKKRLKSFQYAFQGLGDVFRSEPNMRFHVLAAATAITLAAFFRFSPLEWAILVLIIGLVFAAECLNTALEHLTDLVSPEFHPLAGRAKDAAAAAVLVAAISSVVIACFLFAPHFIRLLNE